MEKTYYKNNNNKLNNNFGKKHKTISLKIFNNTKNR